MKGDRKKIKSIHKNGSITHSIRNCAGWGILLTLFLMAGCAGSEKSSYFTLYPMSWLTPKYNRLDSDVSIGIGPVSIPEYLERSQIVSRQSRYSVEISDFNYWAEPLETSIPKVISENLSTILSTDSVYPYPWKTASPEYQVRIEVLQFDGSMPGNVLIYSRWSLLKNGEETNIRNKKFHTKKPIAGQGYEGMVSTMSMVLYDLSYHIAKTLDDEFIKTESIIPKKMH